MADYLVLRKWAGALPSELPGAPGVVTLEEGATISDTEYDIVALVNAGARLIEATTALELLTAQTDGLPGDVVAAALQNLYDQGAGTDQLVKVSSDDTSSGFLEGKVAAGTGISLATLNPGSDEQLEISAATGANDQVAVSNDDTTPDFLENKLVAGSNISLLVTNPGADEKLQISSPAGANDRVGITANDTTPDYLSGKLVAGSGINLLVQNPNADESIEISTSAVASGLEYTVGAATTGAKFTTISAAITAATGTDPETVILVLPGSYTESFTLPTGMSITGLTGRSDRTEITGNITMLGTAATEHALSNLRIEGDILLQGVSQIVVWLRGVDQQGEFNATNTNGGTTVVMDADTRIQNTGGGNVCFRSTGASLDCRDGSLLHASATEASIITSGSVFAQGLRTNGRVEWSGASFSMSGDASQLFASGPALQKTGGTGLAFLVGGNLANSAVGVPVSGFSGGDLFFANVVTGFGTARIPSTQGTLLDNISNGLAETGGANLAMGAVLDGQLLSRAGTSVVGVAPSVFGTQYESDTNTDYRFTTGTAFFEVAKLTTQNLPAGTYRIQWMYIWSYNSAQADFVCRVTVDDAVNLYDQTDGGGGAVPEHRQEPKDTGGGGDGGTNQRHVTSGNGDVALTAGVHEIDIDIASSGPGPLSSVHRTFVSIYRIN